MADPIRPPSWPNLPAATQRTDARSAAQRAFFQLAMGQAAAEEAPARSAEPSRTAAMRGPDLRIELPSDPPEKILRPGSIIDIRV